MPACPDPLSNAGLLRFLHEPAALEDTRPCAAVDIVTEPLDVEAAYNLPSYHEFEAANLPPYHDPSAERVEAALKVLGRLHDLAASLELDVNDSPHWTTVDALNSELEQVEFSTVGTNGVIAVKSDYPAGTPVMVTVQRMGGR